MNSLCDAAGLRNPPSAEQTVAASGCVSNYSTSTTSRSSPYRFNESARSERCV
jgi:hypothetical protein